MHPPLGFLARAQRNPGMLLGLDHDQMLAPRRRVLDDAPRTVVQPPTVVQSQRRAELVLRRRLGPYQPAVTQREGEDSQLAHLALSFHVAQRAPIHPRLPARPRLEPPHRRHPGAYPLRPQPFRQHRATADGAALPQLYPPAPEPPGARLRAAARRMAGRGPACSPAVATPKSCSGARRYRRTVLRPKPVMEPNRRDAEPLPAQLANVVHVFPPQPISAPPLCESRRRPQPPSEGGDFFNRHDRDFCTGADRGRTTSIAWRSLEAPGPTLTPLVLRRGRARGVRHHLPLPEGYLCAPRSPVKAWLHLH